MKSLFPYSWTMVVISCISITLLFVCKSAKVKGIWYTHLHMDCLFSCKMLRICHALRFVGWNNSLNFCHIVRLYLRLITKLIIDKDELFCMSLLDNHTLISTKFKEAFPFSLYWIPRTVFGMTPFFFLVFIYRHTHFHIQYHNLLKWQDMTNN